MSDDRASEQASEKAKEPDENASYVSRICGLGEVKVKVKVKVKVTMVVNMITK